jgi:hypothetical protein
VFGRKPRHAAPLNIGGKLGRFLMRLNCAAFATGE